MERCTGGGEVERCTGGGEVERCTAGDEVERCTGRGGMERCTGGGDVERCTAGDEMERTELEQSVTTTSDHVGTCTLECRHGSFHMAAHDDDEQQRPDSPDSDRVSLEGCAPCQPLASVEDVMGSSTMSCVTTESEPTCIATTSPPKDGLRLDSTHPGTAGTGGVQGAPCVEGGAEPDCTECRITRADPTPRDLIMFLHALSYKVW